MSSNLADRVRAVAVQAEALTRESEDRLAYRRAHGRELSAAHVEALHRLQGSLQALAERVAALLAPPIDVEALRAQYEGLCGRLEEF
jgi:hypothetical protein